MTICRSIAASPVTALSALLGAACVFACAVPAGAQTFFEIGGGWNYLAPPPAGEKYTGGYNARASVGWQVGPRFRMRADAFVVGFDHDVQLSLPCPSTGCSGPPSYLTRQIGVAGLTMNGLASIDSRGLFYVIGGAGLYDAYGDRGNDKAGVQVGVSAGAGIAVPVGVRVRAFVEGRYHAMLGGGAQPPWFVPVTVGIRF